MTRFGRRNRTVLATSVLPVPTGAIRYFVQQPETPLGVFLVLGALTGLGGGEFASATTGITSFVPQREQGWELGLNADGGNIGVAVVQIVGLLVVAVAGGTSPSLVAGIYLPLIVLTESPVRGAAELPVRGAAARIGAHPPVVDLVPRRYRAARRAASGPVRAGAVHPR